MSFRGPYCKECPYQKRTMGFAQTRGEMKHGVLIVLEALGENEALQKLPAVGPTGKLLNRMVERTTDPVTGKLFKNEDFLVTNAMWCRPYEMIGGKVINRTPDMFEYDHCADTYLFPLIEELKPRAILAAGAVPTAALTGYTSVTKLRGYQLESLRNLGIPVIPTYHPAYLMKGKLSLIRVWQMDLLKAVYLARHGKLPVRERHYSEDPGVAEWEGIVGMMLKDLERGEPLSFDIETPYAGALKDDVIDPDELRVEDDASYTIFRIAFCTQPDHAVSVPWAPSYIPGIKALMEHPGKKIVWNRFFDIPRIEFNGVGVRGRVYDGMDMWHFAEPAFPMGLKYAATFVAPDMPPWVLEKEQHPAWYNAADTDVARRAVDWCEAKLKREGRWFSFERHFVDLGQRLQKISLRGIPTSKEKRAEKREKYEAIFTERVQAIQPLVSERLKPIGTPYKKTEAQLRESEKWVEGRMVPVDVTRRETREDIPPEKRCDNAKCSSRWVKELEGKRRCEKHLLKKMKEV